MSKLETYKAVVAGLRELGYGAAADLLEVEQFVLYGDPDAPKPIGILTMNLDLISQEPEYVLRILRDGVERIKKSESAYQEEEPYSRGWNDGYNGRPLSEAGRPKRYYDGYKQGNEDRGREEHGGTFNYNREGS